MEDLYASLLLSPRTDGCIHTCKCMHVHARVRAHTRTRTHTATVVTC